MSSILLVLRQFFGLPLLLVKRAVNFAVDFSEGRVRRLLFCLPGKPVAARLLNTPAFFAHCLLRDKLVFPAACPSKETAPVDVSLLVFSTHAPSLWSSPLRLRSYFSLASQELHHLYPPSFYSSSPMLCPPTAASTSSWHFFYCSPSNPFVKIIFEIYVWYMNLCLCFRFLFWCVWPDRFSIDSLPELSFVIGRMDHCILIALNTRYAWELTCMWSARWSVSFHNNLSERFRFSFWFYSAGEAWAKEFHHRTEQGALAGHTVYKFCRHWETREGIVCYIGVCLDLVTRTGAIGRTSLAIAEKLRYSSFAWRTFT